MTAARPTLAQLLVQIAELAPDLIKVQPRERLYPPGDFNPDPPYHGPLLFWHRSLRGAAGMYGCIAARDRGEDVEVHPSDEGRILQGLLVCCDRLGWESRVEKVAGTIRAVVGVPDRYFPTSADTRTVALAAALLAALRHTRTPPARRGVDFDDVLRALGADL